MMRAGIIAAALLLAACDGEPTAPQLGADGELQVRPAMLRMLPGDSSRLEAVGFDASGLPVFTGTVHWRSLDPQLASIGADGTVTALEPGWARIVAEAGGGAQADTVVIATGLRFSTLAAGDDHVCGLLEDGEAWCWGGIHGAGRFGALGTGSRPTHYAAQPVAGGLQFATLAASQRYTCGIAGSNAYCWGFAESRALGFTSCPALDLGCHVPQQVVYPGPFTEIAVTKWGSGEATCATGAAGLMCWGGAPAGSPGTLCPGCSRPPVAATLQGELAMGTAHGCALDAAGSTWCWGENRSGQLGREIPSIYCGNIACWWSHTPLQVPVVPPLTQLTTGRNFTCGLTADGRAWCWGRYSRWGYITPASPAPGITPVEVSGALRFSVLSAGHGHVCGISTSDRAMYCWGDAAWTGAMGEPLLAFDDVVTIPRRVTAGAGFTAIGAAAGATCAITTGGTTVCMGSESATGLGVHTGLVRAPTPIAPPGPVPDWVTGLFPLGG